MSEQENERPGVVEAVETVGGQTKLAAAMGLTQQTVSYWVQMGYVPAEHVVAVSHLSGVSRQRLVNPRLAELVNPDSFSSVGAS